MERIYIYIYFHKARCVIPLIGLMDSLHSRIDKSTGYKFTGKCRMQKTWCFDSPQQQVRTNQLSCLAIFFFFFDRGSILKRKQEKKKNGYGWFKRLSVYRGGQWRGMESPSVRPLPAWRGLEGIVQDNTRDKETRFPARNPDASRVVFYWPVTRPGKGGEMAKRWLLSSKIRAASSI